MESFIEFAKGPLFRLSIAIAGLGLIRLFVLAIINGFEAKSKAKDKAYPHQYVRKLTWGFIFPIRAFRVKPIYSLISIIFHIGLLVTPLFLLDHILLVDNSIGISWAGIALGKSWADNLTIMTIITGLILLLFRISDKASRNISRTSDFMWPVLLVIPFFTGMIISQMEVSPSTYNTFFLLHVLSGDLILLLLPFTKIAHCVLMPVSQWVTARSWKFVPDGPEEVTIAIGKEGEEL